MQKRRMDAVGNIASQGFEDTSRRDLATVFDAVGMKPRASYALPCRRIDTNRALSIPPDRPGWPQGGFPNLEGCLSRLLWEEMALVQGLTRETWPDHLRCDFAARFQ